VTITLHDDDMRSARLLCVSGVLGLLSLGATQGARAAADPDIYAFGAASGVSIANGGSFGMGTTTVGVPFVQTIVVGNTTGTLAISGVDMPAGFTLTQAPPATVEGGASHGMNVRCDAAAVGTFSGELVIHSDDPDEPDFVINLSCTVQAAGAASIRLVTNTNLSIADGGSITLPPGDGVLVRVYNDEGSTGPLILDIPNMAPAGAVVGTPLPDDVVSAGGASVYINVRCATTLNSSGVPVTGTYTVTLGNNVAGSENPYTFTLNCTDEVPPVTDPPVTDPPATNPPVTNPPVTNPPVTQPGAGAGGPDRGLPSTGGSAVLAWVALGGVVWGVFALWLSRRPAQRNVTR